MEQDILDQLYFGRIMPWENQNDKTPDMKECSEQIYQDIEQLKQQLDKGGKQILERLLDNRSELESRLILEGFKDGFAWVCSLRQPDWDQTVYNNWYKTVYTPTEEEQV